MKHIIFLFLLFSFTTYSQTSIGVKKIAEGLSIPVDISFDINNTMYVVEKRGIIKVIDSLGQNQVFLDITSRVNSGANERGLLGLTFHPDYKNNAYLYVNYTGSNGGTVIARFTRNATDKNKADVSSAKTIMTIAQPFNNHNAGDLSFGRDGFLYIAMGDGGSGGDPNNYAQRPKELLGKMLRIDVNTETSPYLIPADNPYINNTDTLPEIWSIGLRNPWRFSFDKSNGELWIADVGQNKSEEISAVKNVAKLNFGWRCYEGSQSFNLNGCDQTKQYVNPVHTYTTNSNGDGCSITGGYVYRGNTVDNIKGNYVFGDFCTGNMWMLIKNNNNQYTREKIYKVGPQELSTFGEENNGEIYFAEFGNGFIYKIQRMTVSTNDQKENKHVSLIPNPANTKITIEVEDYKKAEIYTINGASLIKTATTQEIDIAELIPGMYLINIYYGITSVSKTFMKE